MVSLIEHAHDAQTPAASSWLLAESVGALLIAMVPTIRSPADYERARVLCRTLMVAVLAGAAASLFVGWLAPAPWLLALLRI